MFDGLGTVKPLLQFISDFCAVMIHDDAKDIGMFRTPSHPSRIHHYQIGFVGKNICDFFLSFMSVGQRMLQSQQQEQVVLQQMLDMMKDQRARNDQQQAERLNSLREYMSRLTSIGGVDAKNWNAHVGQNGEVRVFRKGDVDLSNAIYMGTLDQLKSNVPHPQPHQPRRIKALPYKGRIPEPPRIIR